MRDNRLSMEFGDEYKDTEPLGTPDDGYAEYIDIGTMTADTAELESPEATAKRMVEDVLARSGLEQPDYDSVMPAPQPEVSEPPEPAGEPVSTAVEQDEKSGAEIKPVETVMVGGLRCVPSGLTSALVYPDLEGYRTTHQLALDHPRYLEERRVKHRELGESPSDQEREFIATAQEAVLEYAEALGVEAESLSDRVLPPEQYRFFDVRSEYEAARSAAQTKTKSIACTKLGVGVLLDRGSITEEPRRQLATITHETIHTLQVSAVSLRMKEGRCTERLAKSPYTFYDDKLGLCTALHESAVELATYRVLSGGGYYQRLPGLPGSRPQLATHNACAILSGMIRKHADESGTHPTIIADEIAKGLFTGDESAMHRLIDPLGDKKDIICSLKLGGLNLLRTAEIARELNLPGTMVLLRRWANARWLGLEGVKYRGAYDWR